MTTSGPCQPGQREVSENLWAVRSEDSEEQEIGEFENLNISACTAGIAVESVYCLEDANMVVVAVDESCADVLAAALDNFSSGEYAELRCLNVSAD